MKQAKKVKEALKRRQSIWDNLPTADSPSPSTKIAKGGTLGNGMAYHKPGSQNRRKGSSGRTAHR